MNKIASTALSVVLAASIGFAAVQAFAQTEAPPPGNEVTRSDSGPGRMHGGPRMGPGGPAGGVFNIDRGAEAVEAALDRMAERLDLTPDQQPLFDTFRDVAVTAATELADEVESLRAASQVEGTPSIAQRFADRLALDRARVGAMEVVQPSLTAFFDSLTEEQLQALMPQRPQRGDGNQGGGSQGDRGQGDRGQGDRTHGDRGQGDGGKGDHGNGPGSTEDGTRSQPGNGSGGKRPMPAPQSDQAPQG